VGRDPTCRGQLLGPPKMCRIVWNTDSRSHENRFRYLGAGGEGHSMPAPGTNKHFAPSRRGSAFAASESGVPRLDGGERFEPGPGPVAADRKEYRSIRSKEHFRNLKPRETAPALLSFLRGRGAATRPSPPDRKTLYPSNMRPMNENGLPGSRKWSHWLFSVMSTFFKFANGGVAIIHHRLGPPLNWRNQRFFKVAGLHRAHPRAAL